MSFYVTLPSNASMDYYPDNTLTNYVTKMNPSIQLDDNKYEVSLVEFMYPVNWKYREDGSLVIRDCQLGTEFKYDVKFNAFDSVIDIFEFLNDEFIQDNVKVEFIYNRKQHKAIIKVFENLQIDFLNGLENVFGFRASHFQAPTTSFHLYYAPEPIAPELNSVNSLFLYTDIVEYQHVGNSRFSLLRVVAVENGHKFGDYIHNVFQAPHYIPVSKTFIESIEIDIRDDSGHRIHFSPGKILVKLHFRRKNF